MAEHTPGPWHSIEDTDTDYGHFDIFDTGDNRVADVRNDYCDYDNAMAYWQGDDCPMQSNARLIAASPDMLAALQNIENDDEHMPASAWAMIQAAIAKATRQ